MTSFRRHSVIYCSKNGTAGSRASSVSPATATPWDISPVSRNASQANSHPRSRSTWAGDCGLNDLAVSDSLRKLTQHLSRHTRRRQCRQDSKDLVGQSSGGHRALGLCVGAQLACHRAFDLSECLTAWLDTCCIHDDGNNRNGAEGKRQTWNARCLKRKFTSDLPTSRWLSSTR